MSWDLEQDGLRERQGCEGSDCVPEVGSDEEEVLSDDWDAI